MVRAQNDAVKSSAVNETVRSSTNFNPKDDQTKLLDDKSPGVKRVEAIAASYTNRDVLLLLFSIFLMAYAYDLDGTIRYTYAIYATADFDNQALISTVNVVRSVIGAAAQPTFARLADVFGRFELILISIFFYVIGTIVQAVSTNVSGYCGGVVLYQIGFSGVLILNTILIGDMITLRYRVLGTFVPLLPYLVNVWISGNITSAVLDGFTKPTMWRWGVGMFALILPVISIPLIFMLWFGGRKARKNGVLDGLASPFHGLTFWQACKQLFWLLDVVGIILMICTIGLILVPITLAGGYSTSWNRAKIIAPFVIGWLLMPVFVLWEGFTKHPIFPWKLAKDRGVWGGLGLGLFLDFAWYMQGDYLYTILIVNYGQSVLSATRISNLYTFVSVLTGTVAGMVIALPRVQRVKPFIVFGCVMWLPAFGLLIHYRGAGNGSVSGVIGAEVLLGFGAGFFSYPTITALQAAVKHEYLAVVTGLYLSLFYIGSAIGSAVSGAVYTNLLPGELSRNIAAVSSNTTIATLVYGSATTFALEYPLGSPIREAIIESFKHIQKILCIVGLCLVIPMIGFALCLRDPKLIQKQSIQDDTSSNYSKDYPESHEVPRHSPVVA